MSHIIVFHEKSLIVRHKKSRYRTLEKYSMSFNFILEDVLCHETTDYTLSNKCNT